MRTGNATRRGGGRHWPFWLLLTAVLGYAAGNLAGMAPGEAGDLAATVMAQSTLAWLVAALLIAVASAALLRRNAVQPAAASLRDPVTGLFSDAFLDEVLPGLMARDDRAGHSRLCLVCIEVAELAAYRARYGEAVVDAVHASVGQLIASQVRASDIAVFSERHGLLVLLQADDPEQVNAFCRRVAMLAAAAQLEHHGDVIKPLLDTGAALRLVGESLEQLHQRAQLDLARAAVG